MVQQICSLDFPSELPSAWENRQHICSLEGASFELLCHQWWWISRDQPYFHGQPTLQNGPRCWGWSSWPMPRVATNYKFFQLLKTSVACLLRIKVGPFSSLAQCWNNSAHLPHAHVGWASSVEHRTNGECMPIGHLEVPPDCTVPVWQVTKCRSSLPLTPGVKPSQ